jgi:predicted transcriptional regulator
LGNYRNRLDIIADILRVASRNPKKTHIMYQANLSYKILQRYLSEVSEASLVSFNADSQNYALTEKGQQFLKTYLEYSKNNKSIEKNLINITNKKKILNDLCPNE